MSRLFVLSAISLIILLFNLNYNLYLKVLNYWGIYPYSFPFFDLHNVLASIDCWHEGVDVYTDNVCDVERRSFIYSPLWLRA